MTEEELNRTLAKGEFVYGMGGNGWTFSDDKIFVMTSSVGLFKGKVASIETENSSHSILGIKVGDKYGTASSILEKAGFKESADGYFTKGNVQIQLYGGNVIAKLRINIQDPAYKKCRILKVYFKETHLLFIRRIRGWGMHYRSMAISFMSGTGNSFMAATWMTERAKEKGLRTKLYQISKHDEEDDRCQEVYDLVGMVFPTHGFTAPWLVIRYALSLPRASRKHAFVVATRAGTRIASFPLPGLEGSAGYLIALILLLKGYAVRGVMGFDMPSNWMSLHWGLNLSNSKFIFGRAKVRTDSFIDSILAGRKVFQGILSLLFGLTLSPISLGYLVMGRFWLSKLFFTSENCTGCGQCAKNCPVNAIKMVGSKKPRPYWTFNCESCMRCMGYCPNQAVEVSHSFALVLYYVSTIPVWVYFLSGLNSSLGLGCS